MGIFDFSLPLVFFEPKRKDGFVFMELILQCSLVCIADACCSLSIFILCEERRTLSFIFRDVVLLNNT